MNYLSPISLTRSLQTKLIVFLLAVSIIPVVLVGWLTFARSQNALREQVVNQLVLTRDLKGERLEIYFQAVTEDITFMAHSPTVVAAMLAFNRTQDFYAVRLLGYLGDPTLVNSGKHTAYDVAHTQYHPFFRELVKTQGYNDIYLITPEGQIVYNYDKGDDFATHLKTGSYRNTHLAQLVQQVDKAVEITDFVLYAPSDSEPASFIGAPILVGGQKIGLLVYQLPLARVQELMQNQSQVMGQTGEAYLVGGPDKLVLANTHFTEPMPTQEADNLAVQRALQGQIGVVEVTNYRGRPVLSAYRPMHFGKQTWALLAEVEVAEAFAPIIALRNSVMVIMGLVVLAVTALGIVIARSITKPIVDLTTISTAIAGGDLSQMVSIQTHDELAVLGQAFNTMTIQLRQSFETLEERVQERTHALAAQNAISATISQSLDLETVLNSALNQVLEVTEMESALIYLLEADKSTLTIKSQVGLSAMFVEALRQIKVGEGVSGLAVAHKEPRIFDLANYPTARLSQAIIDENLQVIVSVPLMAKGEALGALSLGIHHARHFSEQDVALLVAIGQQVGVAVENARLYQLIQQANQELTRLNADKDRFFSIVAHDLKGPFMPLLGNAELLTEMGDMLPPMEVKQLGASIQRTARNVFSLLENLLDWVRLEMGRMEYQPQRLDLCEVVAKTVELLSGNAAVKQIDLHSEVQPETWVYADENMLDTVIRNLTNNALKFTPQGGQVVIGSKELGIRNYELGIKNEVTPNSQFLNPNYIEVAIADTGVGMPNHVKEKLFKIDEQITTVGTGKEKGTGLGLIICQEMVVKSGGRIWVESEVGQGTTVRFTVRLAGVN